MTAREVRSFWIVDDIYFERGIDEIISQLNELKTEHSDHTDLQLIPDSDADYHSYMLYGSRQETEAEYLDRTTTNIHTWTEVIERKQKEISALEKSIEEIRKVIEKFEEENEYEDRTNN